MNTKTYRLALIILLLVISAVVRLNAVEQGTFDSFSMHAKADSIILYGYAPWVMHPASLFGYYPLSYPSGLVFLYAYVSLLTGLDMDTTIMMMSLVMGLLGVLLLMSLVIKWAGFTTGFIAGLVFSFSPYYLYFTTWNASARILLVIIAIMLLSVIYRIMTQKQWMRWVVLAVVLVIYGFMAHRTAQLLTIYIAASIGAGMLVVCMHLHTRLQRYEWYRIIPHYITDKPLRFVGAIGLIGVIAILVKVTDLAIRGRFTFHFQRLMRVIDGGWESIMQTVPILYLIVATILMGIFLGVIIAVFFVWPKTIKKTVEHIVLWSVHQVRQHPHRAIGVVLLGVAFYLFVVQFFGRSFYSPSLREYETSLLFSGTAPPIIFINFVINHLTTVSLVIVFAIIGLISLGLKKDKTPWEYVLLLSAVAMSGILLDKRYVRLFIIPIISIFIAYGIMVVINWIMRQSESVWKRIGVYSLLIILVTSIFIGAFVPLLRQQITDEEYNEGIPHFKAAGDYIRSLDCRCSTVTTDELLAGVVIFAQSGIPGASANIYYSVDAHNIEIERRTFEHLWDNFWEGKKLVNIWFIHDWILGGEYYIGRHARLVMDNPFTDPRVVRLIDDYKERFYIHDKQRPPTRYYTSILPVKNKVYDNPIINIHDMRRGAVV